MSNKKEIATKVTETTMTLSDGGMPQQEVFSNLIKLPRLSLQQKMSKAVEEELAKVGDLYENLGNTVVCTKDKPFSFVPLLIKPVITKYKPEGDKFIFEAQAPMTAANAKSEWSIVEDGVTKKVRPEIVCYLFNSEDLDNGNTLILPYVFTFKGASMPKGGKSLYTYSLLLQAAKQPCYSHKFTMTSKKEEKDGNTFQVAYVEAPKVKVDQKHYETIKQWVITLNNMSNIEVAPEEDETAKVVNADTTF